MGAGVITHLLMPSWNAGMLYRRVLLSNTAPNTCDMTWPSLPYSTVWKNTLQKNVSDVFKRRAIIRGQVFVDISMVTTQYQHLQLVTMLQSGIVALKLKSVC